ncbi:unnamed protein product [Trichogramma brassicae]|nr:unnamed protein product [Trichogramma brassicae]
MDLNCTSPQWSCRVQAADVRGALLEEVMHRHDLVAVFRPGNPSTLVRGEKDVDVTLVTSELEALACDWTVREGWTTADHRPITFRIAGREQAGVSRIPRFNTKKADWCRLEREVADRLESVNDGSPTCRQEVDVFAETLGRVLVEAAEVAIPVKKAFPRSVPWWNSRLTDLKKSFNKARRRFQREREPELRSMLKLTSDLLRRRYARACWKARDASWQKLVTQSTSSNPYGFIYKMMNDKITPKAAVNTLAIGDSRTSGWAETAKAMLDGFFADPETADRAVPPSREADVEPWTELEVLKAVGTMKSAMLMNACLGLGRFPSGWKLGAICVLLKSPDKDRSALKSYRPVCLLPILSKVLERLIRWRLEPTIMDIGHASQRQFGFRAERSTADAIELARSIVSDSNEPFAFGILFDVTGAFDNLRWDSVLEELGRRRCPGNLWRLIADYLDDRSVALACEGIRVSKKVRKGAPQGSILGLDLWNICMDPVLREVQDRGGEIVAYADDLLLIVTGGGRQACEDLGQSMSRVIARWADRLCLEISRAKTEMILLKNGATGGKKVTKAGGKRILGEKRVIEKGNLKGSLIKKGKGGARPPCIRIKEGETGIRCKEEVRYLGVTIGTGFSIARHVEVVGARASRLYQRLASLVRAQWGIRYGAMRQLYSGVFLPTSLYAVSAWGDLVTSTLGDKLQSSQRVALIRICRAYRTASTDSLQVCAGLLPLDLECAGWRLRAMIRKGKSFNKFGIEFREGENPRLALGRVDRGLREQWGERWSNSEKGEITKEFFPRVEHRLNLKHIELYHYVSQFLTGHGDFMAKLSSLGLSESSLCACGAEETARHVLLDCERLECTRVELKQQMSDSDTRWPPALSALVETGEMYAVFRRTCRALLLEKRRLDVEERARA